MENFKKIPDSGLYNLGTGKARTFEDLVKATFAGLDRPVNIQYIDMPEDIRDKYQYFTEADMEKLGSRIYRFILFTGRRSDGLCQKLSSVKHNYY